MPQITTVLLNLTRGLPQLNLTAPARIPTRAWDGGHPVAAEESTVIITDGYHVQGALDKGQFGATAFGMVHVRALCSATDRRMGLGRRKGGRGDAWAGRAGAEGCPRHCRRSH